MQVLVFVARPAGEKTRKLLVLPVTPGAAIPPAMREEWDYFATVDVGDKLLAASSGRVASDIERQGYALVEATG